MKEIERIGIPNAQMLIVYLMNKCRSGIGCSVSGHEYRYFIDNGFNAINASLAEEVFPRKIITNNQEFYEICQEAIKLLDGDSNRKLEYRDYKLYPTYDFRYLESYSNYRHQEIAKIESTNINFREYVSRYAELYNEEYGERINTYDLSEVDEKTRTLARIVAGYIVYSMMERYVKISHDEGKWPEQCISDFDKEILDFDLAPKIKLAGSRNRFFELYDHALKLISEMLNECSQLQLSNHYDQCLAYTNFRRIVNPLAFLTKKDSLDRCVCDYGRRDFSARPLFVDTLQRIFVVNGVATLYLSSRGDNHRSFVLTSQYADEIEAKRRSLIRE